MIQIRWFNSFYKQPNVANSYLVTFLSRHLHWSGVWLDVAPRTSTKKGPKRDQKDMCLTKMRLHAQYMITVLGSIANTIGETYVTT